MADRAAYPNLSPNRAGRPSKLRDPEFLRLVAECFAAGMSREDMCKVCDVKDKDTITRWRRDPRVKALVSKLIEDRAIQISRKVDAVIEGRLAHAEDLDTDILLKIRKEYGGATVGRREIADDAVTAGALRAMEEDPDLLEKMVGLLDQEAESNPSATEDAGVAADA